MVIDVNCDMGEGFGVYRIGDDAALLPWITSANIACGFHAGDPRIMLRTVEAALAHGIGLGAHPSYPDRVGFGRRNLALTAEEVYTDVLYQIGALAGIAKARGARLQHVKPHGQLMNQAVKDPGLAEAVVSAIRDADAGLVLVAYGGALIAAGEHLGLQVAHELYADRAYQPDGALVPRSHPQAVLHDPAIIVARAVRMIQTEQLEDVNGDRLPFRADTICVHGDSPGAVAIAKALRQGLEAAGIQVAPLSALRP